MAKNRRYLYEQLAGRIARLIEQGTLQAGDRVPSVRKLGARQRLSVSTVLQAYGELESRGLIAARPQSGYYVQSAPRFLLPEPSVSRPSLDSRRVTVNDLVARVVEAAHDSRIVPLGTGCASPELLPTVRLNRLMAAIARQAGPSVHLYDFPPGNLELRRQIARRSLDFGCSLSSDDFVTTSGCMEALNLCLRAVSQPGDTIAVESPTYFGILQIVESLGMKAVEVPTYPRHGICLDALQSVLKRHRVKACVALTNIHNPLGGVMPEEKKKLLVEMLARREIPLIEDDLYGDLFFGDTRPVAAKAFDRNGLVLLCSSYSKTLSPGYRVGWVAPGRYLERVKSLKFITSVATSTLPQMTLAEFLKHGGYDRHLRRLRKAFASQVQQMREAISQSFPDGTKITQPAGGHLLWVELPRRLNSLELHTKALAENISIAPGPIFSPKQSYKNCFRVNCGYPWSGKIEQAVVTLGRLAQAQAKRAI